MLPATPQAPIHPAPRHVTPRPSNRLAWLGFSMVLCAAIGSPLSFLGAPFCVLLPLGLAGLVISAVSLKDIPRWPGILAIVIGLGCLGFWGVYFTSVFSKVQSNASRFGMTIDQHAQLSMTAMSVFETAETQRGPAGSPAATFDWTPIAASDRVDPWGRPLVYQLTSTPRGYTFLSSGADGVSGTPDDIDLASIGDDISFQLPPIKPPRLK